MPPITLSQASLETIVPGDHQLATMRPISEDSFVAVQQAADNMSETDTGNRQSVAPEESAYYTVGDSNDGVENGDDDVVSQYPSGHDMANIWELENEDDDHHPGTTATEFVSTIQAASAAGPSTRLSEAIGNTSAVDLSSGTITAPTTAIRRGPRIRHDRLQRSETMATTQQAMFGPDEEALTADQLRAQDRLRHVYILLSTILTSASITLLVTCSVVLSLFEKHIVEDNQDLVADKGALIACIAMGGMGTIVGFILVCLAYLKHAGPRKTATQDDGNSWIEMAHRNKPLPRVPGLLAENPNPKQGWDDPKINAAWNKIYQDKDGLRTYVEALEMRYARLLAAQDDGKPPAPPKKDGPVGTRDLTAEAMTTGRATRDANNGRVEHRANVPSPLAQVTNSRDSTATDGARVVDNTKVSTRSSYNHAAKGSISGQALIRRDSDAETVTSGSADTVGHELRRSGSEASILTVLCDAVQQPYSPLGGRPDATITTSTLDHAGTPEASMIQSGEGMRSSFASSHRLSNPRLRRYGLLDPPVPDHFSRHMANREEDRETDGNGKDRAD